MGIEELKFSTHPKTFGERDFLGGITGIARAHTPEQAAALFVRGDEYLRVWREMLSRGEEIGPVITNPSQTTPEEAILNSLPQNQ